MLNPIQTLTTEVINQISAGEVVERPANMVKELMENSIDAGADKIEIHFSEGGRFVQIKDNGCGIKDSELHLALSPHSTSKISALKDIWLINSYGFRGEALASISEVSDLTLVSKPADQKQAGRLRSDFGKKTSIQHTGSEKGTTIIVKDLFQKTPARLKFLKSPASETALIKNTVKAIALAHPQIEFRILHKNKLLFYWPAVENLQKRAEGVLSLTDTFWTNTKSGSVNVEAVLCAPNKTAVNKKQMWFFVGRRWVEDGTIHSAVLSAYRGLLMHGEYPILVLNLSCPSEDLDVNIHPAKSKVRFKNSSIIFRAVHHSLRSVLEKAPWIKTENQKSSVGIDREMRFPGVEFNQTRFQKKNFNFNEGGYEKSFQNKKSSMSSDGVSSGSSGSPSSAFITERGRGNKGETSSAVITEQGRGDKGETSSAFITERGRDNEGETSSVSSAIKNMNIEPGFATGPSSGEAQEEQRQNYWSSLYVLSQAHLTYILAQSRMAVIFIDQHAAHERVLYERLMLSWNTGKGDVQNRLVPLALDLEESSVSALLSVREELLKLGLELERSGPDGLVIHSAPAILKDVALQKALVQFADEIKSLGGSFAVEKKIADLCASMACHSAIRAGQALSQEEMKALLVQMDEFSLSSFCPHGRPVFVRYPLSRLEKDFGRRV